MYGGRKYRRYQGRKRYRGRRRGRRGGRSWMGTAGKALATAGTALALARGVKDLINVEYKHVDTTFSAVNLSTTATFQCMSLIAQGDDYTMRNGRSVKCTGFNVNGQIVHNSSGTDAQVARIIIFQDMHGDGGTPTGGDILASASQVYSFRNLDDTDRFKVLYDRTFDIESATNELKIIKYRKKLSTKLEFLGTLGTVAHTGAGSIWIMGIANVASNGPQLFLETRLRFIDN